MVSDGARGVCGAKYTSPDNYGESDGELAYKRGSVVVAISRANR